MRATWTAVAMVGLVGCAPVGATSTTPALTGSSTPVPTVTGPGTPTGPALVEDRFLQEMQAQVDVLIVVQSTPGSADLQDAFGESFPSFLDYFLGSGLDYHIGFVAADIDDPVHSGQLIGSAGRQWIDADTPNPIDTAMDMVSIGETAAAAAQPLGAVYYALEIERDAYNVGFFRDEATHHVVIVGDGTDATDPARIDPAGFVAWFDALEADPTHRSLSCLLAPGAVGTDCSDASVALGEGVVDELRPEGIDGAAVTAAGLRRRWPLTQVPDPATIEVAVEDVTGALLQFDETDWAWDPVRNDVALLEYIPNAMSTVVITYEPAP
jgi:hypothetical protein